VHHSLTSCLGLLLALASCDAPQRGGDVGERGGDVGVLDGASLRDAPLDANAAVPADASAPADGGPALLAALPFDRWSYVPIPGAVCGNGSPAAIGVSPHAGATEVLVFFSGGGACWDEDCLRGEGAVHIAEDYTPEILAAEVGLFAALGWEDSASTANPFRESHLVFIPYCTGDVHAGDAEAIYDPARPTAVVHHRGARNTALFVEAMRASWPELARVRVMGGSAGAFGATLAWDRFGDAWPGAELVILADSGQLVEPPAALWATFHARWGLRVPPGCSACEASFSAYYDHFDARYPATRFALMGSMRDGVISSYFGIDDLATRTDALLRGVLADNETTRYFMLPGDEHVLLGDYPTITGPDGTPLAAWLIAWLTGDDAGWRNVRP